MLLCRTRSVQGDPCPAAPAVAEVVPGRIVRGTAYAPGGFLKSQRLQQRSPQTAGVGRGSHVRPLQPQAGSRDPPADHVRCGSGLGHGRLTIRRRANGLGKPPMDRLFEGCWRRRGGWDEVNRQPPAAPKNPVERIREHQAVRPCWVDVLRIRYSRGDMWCGARFSKCTRAGGAVPSGGG